MKTLSNTVMAGVYPVLPTPFDVAKAVDADSLRRLVRYLLRAGVDGMTFPGVASEFLQLSESERLGLVQLVLDEVAGRVPVIVGVTAQDSQTTLRLARAALGGGAAALMIAAPAHCLDGQAQIAYFSGLGEALGGAPIMLQNVPPPVGAGLAPEVIVEILKAVPSVRYVKEETLPSGQRLSVIQALAPASLLGVFGGAGGRFITDELRRGAIGTMPAIELAEVHVALFDAHRAGRQDEVRRLFTRMLPILNIQGVFRWALTKYVLHHRGLISAPIQRIAGPLLDPLDCQDVDAFLHDLNDLLLSTEDMEQLTNSATRP